MTQGFTTIPIKHPLLDGTYDTDTIAGTPAAGDLVYASGAGYWSRYPLGSTGQVLTVLGTTAGWAPAASVSHNLLSSTHPDTTPASPPSPGNMILASGSTWQDYGKGATGQFLRVLGTTVGWQGLALSDITGVGGAPSGAVVPHQLDGSTHFVMNESTGTFLRAQSAGSFGFESIPFSIEGTMLTPASGSNIALWRAAWPATVTAMWGYQDVGTGSIFTARKKTAAGVFLYHLPSGAITKTADAWTSGGNVLNTSYSVGDQLQIVFGSGAGGLAQQGIQVDLTRP